MKNRFICLLILCMISLSSTVFAANWVRVGTDEYFIDSETAVKNGDIFYYWEVAVDEAGYKWLIHYRVCLTNPPRVKMLNGYLYDPNNQLLNEIIRPHSFTVQPGWPLEKAIDVALTYVKEGEATDITPTLP